MSCKGEGATHHLACECREAAHAAVARERDEYLAALDAVLTALYEATGDTQTYPLSALGERVRRAIQRPAREQQSLMDYMAERT